MMQVRSKYMYSLTRIQCAENGRNKESYRNLLWIGRMERGLHALIVRIELEMCINFAQVYLRNG